jgi:hypothetical protein
MQGAAGSKAGARSTKTNAAAVDAPTKLNIATDVTQLIGRCQWQRGVVESMQLARGGQCHRFLLDSVRIQ